ncbi:MAG: HlyC/CorC family transporter [Oscillospiraceae bacterium]|nr:HlyC/CorC family transporter [Oscillospiraceae bacterium]
MAYAAIVVLLFLSAFFSASETAFSSVNRIRLKQASETDRRAARALSLAEDFDKTLTTILVGNNIVNILSASIGTVVCTRLFGVGGVGVATVAMTVLVLIFGEILPKSIAKDNAEGLTKAFAVPLYILGIVLTPVTFLFTLIKGLIARKDDVPSVTEDELKYILNEIEEEGVLEERERDIVKSALEIDDMQVSEVLIPRVRIIAVEEHDSREHIRQVFIEERYSRLPVYDKTIDNITGFIHEKDFFRTEDSGDTDGTVESIIKDILYVTEFETVSAVLSKMQKSKIHMAVVKDQYGGTFGLVTMEDLIEEILGEIYDEADEEDQSLRSVATEDGRRVYDAAADLSINDFTDKTGIEIPVETDSVTLGGLVMELSGRIPEEGEEIPVPDTDIVFTVTEAEDSRLIRLRIEAAGELRVEIP